MLKFDLVQNDKNSNEPICYNRKISDFSVAQMLYKHVVINGRFQV